MKTSWIMAGLAGLALAGGLTFAVAQNKPAPAAEVAQATASFTVENMTCATCPISVKKAMMRVTGVRSVEINYETKVATVVYDPALTTPEAIAAASTHVGYPAAQTA